MVGGLNLGGSIEPIYNAVGVVEAAADKGAKMLLLPVSTRKQLVELDDDVATRVTVVFYSDARDALLKALLSDPGERSRRAPEPCSFAYG